MQEEVQLQRNDCGRLGTRGYHPAPRRPTQKCGPVFDRRENLEEGVYQGARLVIYFLTRKQRKKKREKERERERKRDTGKNYDDMYTTLRKKLDARLSSRESAKEKKGANEAFLLISREKEREEKMKRREMKKRASGWAMHSCRYIRT